MGYDIYFVRRDPGQSFEDALDQTEDWVDGEPGPLGPEALELWEDVLPVARRVLGDVEEFGDEATRELTHPATGIQLLVFNGEMSIHVREDETPEALATVQRLAEAIERATGLEGYNTALDEPVSGREGLGDARGDSPSWDDRDDDDDAESDGTSITLPDRRPRRERTTAGDAPSKRWWERLRP